MSFIWQNTSQTELSMAMLTGIYSHAHHLDFDSLVYRSAIYQGTKLSMLLHTVESTELWLMEKKAASH